MQLNKGDIVTIRSKQQGYGAKARPVIVYQNSLFNQYVESVTVIPLTSLLLPNNSFRILISPDAHNGLLQASQAMIDKISTFHGSDIGDKIGIIQNEQIILLNKAISLWLDL